MAKLAQSTIKYLIEAEFTADGVVEKPDVIGAIFGQTEGLLGQDLDLRELQRTGRIGRIDVDLDSEEGKTSGKIVVPSSLDSSETSLIAASFETIERIGPCNAKVKISNVKDVRMAKREFMVDRARDILQRLIGEEIPATTAITEKIKETIRTSQVQEFMGLLAGPDVENADEVIIVEGRADVLTLLKNGMKNVIAIGGTIIPHAILNITKERIATLFVDGDRGGELIVKEMMQLADIDYVAKAPEGKEVEELSKKEIFKALREKIPIEQYKVEPKPKELKEFISKREKQAKSEVANEPLTNA
ncbi:MAG TPA: DNA primase DnaG [archaeon]|nr:DNA primase DnaG [archaeon]